MMTPTGEITWGNLIQEAIGIGQNYELPDSKYDFWKKGGVPFLFHGDLRDNLAEKLNSAKSYCLLLTGYYGSGKTVLAYNVALKLQHDHPEKGYFAVLVNLSKSMSVENALRTTLIEFCKALKRRGDIYDHLPLALQKALSDALAKAGGDVTNTSTDQYTTGLKTTVGVEMTGGSQAGYTVKTAKLNANEAVITLGNLLQDLDNWNGSVHPVFILDEFDQIPYGTLINLFQEMCRSVKMLRSCCKSSFIFVGGPVIHQSYLAGELNLTGSLLDGFFQAQVYLPYQWTMPPELLRSLVVKKDQNKVYKSICKGTNEKSGSKFSSEFTQPFQQFAECLTFCGGGRILRLLNRFHEFVRDDQTGKYLFFTPYQADEIIRDAQEMEKLRRYMACFPASQDQFLCDIRCYLYFFVLEFEDKKMFSKSDLLEKLRSNKDISEDLIRRYSEHLDVLLELFSGPNYGYLEIASEKDPVPGSQDPGEPIYRRIVSESETRPNFLSNLQELQGGTPYLSEELNAKYQSHARAILGERHYPLLSGFMAESLMKNKEDYTVYSVIDSELNRFHVSLRTQQSYTVSSLHEVIFLESPWLLGRTEYIMEDKLLVGINEEPLGLPLKPILHDLGAKNIYLYISQLLELVEQAHEKGICNIGIRPENLIITSDYGTIKLERLDHASKTSVSVCFSDSMYAAPETRIAAPTKHSDYFSIGMLLLHMVLNECPDPTKEAVFAGTYIKSHKAAHLNFNYAKMTELLKKMTHFNKDYRLCSKEEILNELRASLNVMPPYVKKGISSTVSVYLCLLGESDRQEWGTADGPQIVVLKRITTNECYKLDRVRFRVGCGIDADCKLTAYNVRPVHFEITRCASRYTLKNKDGLTLLNNERLQENQQVILRHGDSIAIGNEIFIFRTESGYTPR